MNNPGTIIRRMQITEKSTGQSETQGKYFFTVAAGANKVEIKREVERIYGVPVKSVNTMNYMGKQKRDRRGRTTRRPDWKRAVVTLKEGSKIDLT